MEAPTLTKTAPLKTLFLNPPSFENFDGGASSRWPATREIESYWYPVWLAYPAGLLDIHFVHEAMEDQQIAAFLETLTKREVLSVVPPPPGVVLDAYRAKVAERFANPKIGDTVARLCFDGSNRQPKFILPTVADRLAGGGDIRGLALVSALWCRYCYGESESGKLIAPNDPAWDRLQAASRLARGEPRAFLAMHDIFGALAKTPAYVAAFSNALATVWSQGVRAALDDYLAGKP